MKIAIITSGILPIPAVQGGAVENLIDFYLDYNNTHKLHDITIYSIFHKGVTNSPALSSDVNHYEYINTKSILYRLKMKVYGLTSHEDTYFYNLEYYFEEVFKKMEKRDFDLIILENRPGFAIKLKQRRPNTPIMSRIHTNTLYEYSKKNEAIFKATDKFIAVSDYIRSQIENVGLPIKTETVYNGLDPTIFNNKVSPIERKHVGFTNEDFVVIYTGRLVPDKGIKELLLAIQILKDHKDIKLLIIGSENFADSKSKSPFLEGLEQIANTLEKRIVFTGFISYNILPKYIATANLMVVPSHINEALGMVCIEACAMGLPVIATNDGGIPETLIGQKSIIIDKNHDLPHAIADAILEIKNHYSDYQGNYLNPIFTKETYAQSFFKCIEELN